MAASLMREIAQGVRLDDHHGGPRFRSRERRAHGDSRPHFPRRRSSGVRISTRGCRTSTGLAPALRGVDVPATALTLSPPNQRAIGWEAMADWIRAAWGRPGCSRPDGR